MAHSAETRAAVMAALLEGQSLNKVAAAYQVPKATVARWKHEGVSGTGTQKEQIGALVLELLRESLQTAIAQVVIFRDEKWIKRQDASQVAVLYGVNLDKAIRLLEAFAASEATPEDQERS
jgi:transposase-like protein